MAYDSERTCFDTCLEDSLSLSFDSLSLLFCLTSDVSERLAELRAWSLRFFSTESVIVAFFLNIFSREINLLLTKLARNLTGKLSAFGLFFVLTERTNVRTVKTSGLSGRKKAGRWSGQSSLGAMCDAERDWHERFFRASGAINACQKYPLDEPEIKFS